MAERNTLAIEQNALTIGKLADGMTLLRSAWKGPAETVDRFIRGMEGDGHRK